MREQKNVTDLHPFFLIICFLISGTVIGLGMRYSLSRFTPLDELPTFTLLTPKKSSEFGNIHSDIQVGLYINQFDTFDIAANNFIFSGTIWFLFEPGSISLDLLQLFSFDRGEILYRSKPEYAAVGNKIIVKFHIRVKFASTLNYTHFPLDDHRIFITLIHQFVSSEEIMFSTTKNEFIVQPIINGWDLINTHVKTGYVEVPLDLADSSKKNDYPIALFALDYARTSTRYVFSILMPMLIIFYISLFCFTMQSGALQLALAGPGALVGYRFVIENLSPKVGYFMVSDYLFLLILCLLFVVFIVTLIDAYVAPISVWMQRSIVVMLHTILLAFSLYFFMS